MARADGAALHSSSDLSAMSDRENDEVSAALVARRTAAVLAASSAGLHAVMLGHTGSAAFAVLIAVMVGACLYCAYELWLSGTLRAWCLVAVMNLAMVAVHLPMSGAHHVTHMDMNAVVPQSMIMTVGDRAVDGRGADRRRGPVLSHPWQRESGRATGIGGRAASFAPGL